MYLERMTRIELALSAWEVQQSHLNRLSDGPDASQDEVDAGEELLAVVVLG